MTTAAAPPDTITLPTREDLRHLLLNRDFSALTALFSELHRRHAAGQLSERDLQKAYAGASTYREELTSPLREWAGQAPSLCAAQLAWGLHLFAQALTLRTMRLAKDIPPERLETIAGAMMAAQAQMQSALALDPQITLAYDTLIWIETQQGERAWDLYLAGLKHVPRSMVLRQAMLGNLRTEWGGSQEAQDAFLTRPEHDLLSPENKAELYAIHQGQLGHHRLHFQRDRKGARDAYLAALKAFPKAQSLCGLAGLSGPLAKRKLHQQAVELAPDDLHARALRALGLLETWAPAGPQLAELRFCAEWGEPYASDNIDLPLWLMRLRPVIIKLFRL